MKVNLENGTVLDTDKLSDKDAEIHEALVNLYNICEKYNVTSVTRIILNDKKFVGTKTFKRDVKGEPIVEDVDFLFNSLNHYLQDVTNGEVMLIRKMKDDSDGA